MLSFRNPVLVCFFSTLFCLASRTALASVVAKQKVNTSTNSLGTKEIHLLVAVTLIHAFVVSFISWMFWTTDSWRKLKCNCIGNTFGVIDLVQGRCKPLARWSFRSEKKLKRGPVSGASSH